MFGVIRQWQGREISSRVATILLLIVCASTVQAGWIWQNPRPQGEHILAATFIDNNTGFAVGRAGTFFRTTDGGNSWLQRTVASFRDLRGISFPDAETGYVVGDSGAILKTIDGGVSWFTQTTPTTRWLNAVDFPVDAVTGCAAGDYGTLMKTTDGGGTWVLQNSGVTSPLTAVDFPRRDTGYVVGSSDVVLKTTNGGTTWNLANTGGQVPNMVSVRFPNGPDTGYVTGDNYNIGRTIKTVNGGTTWFELFRGSYTSGGTTLSFPNGADTGYVGWWQGFYLPWTGVYKTMDGGANWTRVLVEPNGRRLRSICFPEDGLTGYALGDFGVVYKTQDGGASWPAKHSAASRVNLHGIDVSRANAGRAMAVGDAGNVLRTTNAGLTWDSLYPGVNNALRSVVYVGTDTVLAVGDGGRVVRSPDGGATWHQIPSGTSDNLLSTIFAAGSGVGYAVGTGGRILKTTDDGLTWAVQTSGTSNALSSAAFPASGSNTVVTVGNSGDIRKTTNGGGSWVQKVSGTGNALYGVCFPMNGNVGYAVGQNGTILKTLDAGESWGTQSSGTTAALRFVRFPISPNVGYAAGDNGVILKTTNGGTNWVRIPSPTWFALHGGCFPTCNDTGYVVGENGMILRTMDGGGYAGTGPAIALNPAALNVTLPLGGSTTRVVLVENVGNAILAWQVSESLAVQWLSESPDSGRVLAGTQMALDVRFDAAGLDSGTYMTTLRVTSNDPGNPRVILPVMMRVASDSTPRIIVDTVYSLLPGQPLTIQGRLRNYDGLPYVPPPYTFGVDDPVGQRCESLATDSVGGFSYTVVTPDTARFYAFRFFLSYGGHVVEQLVVVPILSTDTFYTVRTNYLVDVGKQDSLSLRTSLLARWERLLRPPSPTELLQASVSGVRPIASALLAAWNRYAANNPGLRLIWPVATSLGADGPPPRWFEQGTAAAWMVVHPRANDILVPALTNLLDSLIELAPGLQNKPAFHAAVQLTVNVFTGVSAMNRDGLIDLGSAVLKLTGQDGLDVDTVVVHDVVLHGDTVVSFMISACGGGGTVLSAAIGPRPESTGTTGWGAQISLPSGPKGKMVKDGGALAYGKEPTDANDTGYVYALKGNNRCEFYRYNTITGDWMAKESIPALNRNMKKKGVKKGSSLAFGINGKVYATKGNNTLDFWQYDPAIGVWTQRADVPTGAKACKEGVGAVAVKEGSVNYIYLLRGSGTQDFYRYNADDNTWDLTLPTAPGGLSGKTYKNGSCLAYDNGDTIYCLKGSYNEFAAYSISSRTWMTRNPLPLIAPPGTKKKKVKDGAGMACYGKSVYALKGGNTDEFWMFSTTDQQWHVQPQFTVGSKKVKGGGALTFADANKSLYAFRGNNTLEFWKYGPLSTDGYPLAANGVQKSVQGQSAVRSPQFALSIIPNPFTSSLNPSISYSLPVAGKVSLKLYDVTGKLVSTLASGYHPAGSYRTGLSAVNGRLSAGVYLLKFETADYRTTDKLVIE